MEEICICKCGSIEWIIYSNRLECVRCLSEYEWPIDFKASDLINICKGKVNDK